MKKTKALGPRETAQLEQLKLKSGEMQHTQMEFRLFRQLSKDLELLLDTPIEYNFVLQLERKATDFVVVGRTEIGGKEDEVLQ
ncbi:hypothetical protein ACFX19_022989 [Malus domestica]